ncbi:phosphoribosylglycinamide formyltransferase [Legionella beliardensis]|uniref:Phosphoribosylglycinamide formyltransferase n=1 Tax=Legionella beliardensis TaxID=91822 RepID=A0A378I8K7_9GAMM|nr:phosphoribosylglycinamide formyltransferase [Legionella beliardensis]STX28704.1 phosphoribosylglycinamide formyltransferase [Legionella beliardensis]
MIRLGILGSTRGTNLLALVEAIKNKKLNASIEIVLSNKPDALILDKAAQFGLPSQYLSSKGLSREEFDQRLTDLLKINQVELIVLIGYMRILSPIFIHNWRNKIINIHPSLLPAFAGLMDLDVHRAVLAAGEKQSGCTVHVVTEEIDSGPIILQKQCDVLEEDTPEELKARIQDLEGALLVEAITLISQQKNN